MPVEFLNGHFYFMADSEKTFANKLFFSFLYINSTWFCSFIGLTLQPVNEIFYEWCIKRS